MKIFFYSAHTHLYQHSLTLHFVMIFCFRCYPPPPPPPLVWPTALLSARWRWAGADGRGRILPADERLYGRPEPQLSCRRPHHVPPALLQRELSQVGARLQRSTARYSAAQKHVMHRHQLLTFLSVAKTCWYFPLRNSYFVFSFL